MKNILILLLLIFFTGCGLKPIKIDINNYAIEFDKNIKNIASSSNNLLVLKPKIAKGFNSKNIIYSVKPYSFESYAKNRWLDLPSAMIQTQLLNSIEDSNIFKNVVDTHSKIDSNYLLETNISKLYHKIEGQKSYAILKVKFLLIKNRVVINSFIYNKKILCDINSPYGFVKALNQSFDDISLQLNKSLLNSL